MSGAGDGEVNIRDAEVVLAGAAKDDCGANRNG